LRALAAFTVLADLLRLPRRRFSHSRGAAAAADQFDLSPHMAAVLQSLKNSLPEIGDLEGVALLATPKVSSSVL
jgi:hypothetical protein